jgi:tRNA 2-thiocytidine biosynthesis protein TtcA
MVSDMSEQELGKIRRQMVRAMADFEMLGPNDNLLVAVSGGKDSAVLLLAIDQIRKKAPFKFNYQPLMINQHNPGFDPEPVCQWFAKQGIPIAIHDEDTYSVVRDKIPYHETPCSLCARLRRGILYSYAVRNGFNKIALGHHRDDLNETLLLNLFFSGKIASMPPKLKSDDGRNIVIRPLCYVGEEDLRATSRSFGIPTATCTDCIAHLSLRRAEVKKLIKELEQSNPSLRGSLLTAQQNLRPSQLMDQRWWDLTARSQHEGKPAQDDGKTRHPERSETSFQ